MATSKKVIVESVKNEIPRLNKARQVITETLFICFLTGL